MGILKKMRTDAVMIELLEGGEEMVANHGVTVTYFPHAPAQHPPHIRSYEQIIGKMNDEVGCVDVVGRTAKYGGFVSMTTSVHVGKLIGECRFSNVPYRVVSATDDSVLEDYTLTEPAVGTGAGG